jgi:monovalent cation:H+ antiporter-2, CPA2 family
VVPETFEWSLMLASHALVLLGVPLKRVVRRIRDVRADRYGLLRGFFHGGSDEASPDEALAPRLHSLLLAFGAGGKRAQPAGACAQCPGRERYRHSPARGAHGFTGAETRLQDGDVAVLLGTPERLAAAEMRLLQGTK